MIIQRSTRWSGKCVLTCQCQSLAPPSTTQTLHLDHFISYTMSLHASVIFANLYLLQHLKLEVNPEAKGSSGHCLFISSFMFTSKIICDDTYSRSVMYRIMLPLNGQNQICWIWSLSVLVHPDSIHHYRFKSMFSLPHEPFPHRNLLLSICNMPWFFLLHTSA